MLQKKEVFILIIVGSVLFLLVAFFLLLFVSHFYRKKRNIQLERELLKKRFNESLLQSQLEIKEQTLQNVSYELHDNLGQVASLIKINLNTFPLHDPLEASRRLEDTKELIRQLISDIKGLSVSLGSDSVVRNGLVWALAFEKDRLARTGQFVVRFDYSGEPVEINADRAIILYRIVQEVLNNSIKHSKATQIDIQLKRVEDGVQLVIKDDGIGFDVENRVGTGAGLFNLRYRASLIDANILIESRMGGGTTVSIKFKA